MPYDDSNSFPEIIYPAKAYDQSIPAAARAAAQTFDRDGALLIRNCFDPAFIAEAAAQYASHKDQQMSDIKGGRALFVGDKRYMITLPTDGIFGSPELIAAPRVLSVLDHFLGDNYILGSLTSVLSLGGSRAQRWHRDNSALFPEETYMLSPGFLISLIVPLMPIDETVGATEVLPGSHKSNSSNLDYSAGVYPDQINLGDAYLMDARLMHRGMANSSEIGRPILAIVYQRPWYIDYQNFKNQERLVISQETVERFPEDQQRLISWAVS